MQSTTRLLITPSFGSINATSRQGIIINIKGENGWQPFTRYQNKKNIAGTGSVSEILAVAREIYNPNLVRPIVINLLLLGAVLYSRPSIIRTSLIRTLDYPNYQINDIHSICGVHQTELTSPPIENTLLHFSEYSVTGDCRIFAPGKQNPKSVKDSLFGISSDL